ncbi:hypothetical protein WJX84_001304 [Apatococcus fuscideae]|uniref:Uncharacterized protein n=1 Tax=Apatococcus fuscideae TaxID=2026836 RepID=A0AAW1TGI3_9CHLO
MQVTDLSQESGPWPAAASRAASIVNAARERLQASWTAREEDSVSPTAPSLIHIEQAEATQPATPGAKDSMQGESMPEYLARMNGLLAQVEQEHQQVIKTKQSERRTAEIGLGEDPAHISPAHPKHTHFIIGRGTPKTASSASRRLSSTSNFLNLESPGSGLSTDHSMCDMVLMGSPVQGVSRAGTPKSTPRREPSTPRREALAVLHSRTLARNPSLSAASSPDPLRPLPAASLQSPIPAPSTCVTQLEQFAEAPHGQVLQIPHDLHHAHTIGSLAGSPRSTTLGSLHEQTPSLGLVESQSRTRASMSAPSPALLLPEEPAQNACASPVPRPGEQTGVASLIPSSISNREQQQQGSTISMMLGEAGLSRPVTFPVDPGHMLARSPSTSPRPALGLPPTSDIQSHHDLHGNRSAALSQLVGHAGIEDHSRNHLQKRPHAMLEASKQQQQQQHNGLTHASKQMLPATDKEAATATAGSRNPDPPTELLSGSDSILPASDRDAESGAAVIAGAIHDADEIAGAERARDTAPPGGKSQMTGSSHKGMGKASPVAPAVRVPEGEYQARSPTPLWQARLSEGVGQAASPARPMRLLHLDSHGGFDDADAMHYSLDFEAEGDDCSPAWDPTSMRWGSRMSEGMAALSSMEDFQAEVADGFPGPDAKLQPLDDTGRAEYAHAGMVSSPSEPLDDPGPADSVHAGMEESEEGGTSPRARALVRLKSRAQERQLATISSSLTRLQETWRGTWVM